MPLRQTVTRGASITLPFC